MNHLLSVSLVALTLAAGAAPDVAAQSPAMQKGISVELVPTSNAVSLPGADFEDSLIVTVTHDGVAYLGINQIAPAELSKEVRRRLAKPQTLYIKADARSLYAALVPVLAAARSGGAEKPFLLTTQLEQPDAGSLVHPRGLEVEVGSAPYAGSPSTVVHLLTSGVYVNNEQIPWTSFQPALKQLLKNRTDNAVFLEIDTQVKFSQVAHAIDACRSTGAAVVLVTPEQ
jgi:biopolymer transport protein ExbD